MEKAIEMRPVAAVRTLWRPKEAAESIIRSTKRAVCRQSPATPGLIFAPIS
ncbi:MAG: hypothetical protein K2J15_00910 [Muribaculaceae bacterium]|nr:hypothetical protein [Muribaculaceae bacterium]